MVDTPYYDLRPTYPPVDGYDDIEVDTTGTTLDQIAQIRQANATYHFGGLPHRWVELFGGKLIGIYPAPPDIRSYRQRWYYNSNENALYAKITWWQPTDVKPVEYEFVDDMEPTCDNMLFLKRVRDEAGVVINAHMRAPDPYAYNDQYYYNILNETIYYHRYAWVRESISSDIGRSVRYIDGSYKQCTYPTLLKFLVNMPEEVHQGAPFEVTLQCVYSANEEVLDTYTPSAPLRINIDGCSCTTDPPAVPITGWVNGAKTFDLTLNCGLSNGQIGVIISFHDDEREIVGGDDIIIVATRRWDEGKWDEGKWDI